MAFKRFTRDDILFNTIKAHPEYKFYVYNQKMYLDNKKGLSGVNNGYISLYELNINRTPDKYIYPFVYKGSSEVTLNTVTSNNFHDTDYGEIIKGAYPLSASLTRAIIPAGDSIRFYSSYHDLGLESYTSVHANKKYINALRNSLDDYRRYSRHFHYEIDDGEFKWNKGDQKINLISIPSIFYGSSIKKESVTLSYYHTGTLIAEISDVYGNGELIQTTGSNLGEVAGVVMYSHGFILLTGSWNIDSKTAAHDGAGSTATPKWVNFGVGMPHFGSSETTQELTESSFGITFKGTNSIPTLTMFAHAEQGRNNFSTNLTSVEYNSRPLGSLGPKSFKLAASRFKNVVKSEYSTHQEEYQSEVYISKVGIYDSRKNLLGYVTLANPVRKTENRDYTFKIKLDV